MTRSGTNARINTANIASFCFRLSVEIDVMLGRMFDHEREQVQTGIENVERFLKLSRARDEMYKAHTALLAAQAALIT